MVTHLNPARGWRSWLVSLVVVLSGTAVVPRRAVARRSQRDHASRPARSGRMMSVRQGNGSTPISDAEFSAEHKCSFWNSLSAG